MAFLSKTDVTQSQLVSGIIGTIDIGSIVGNSITLQDDINRATAFLNTLEGALQKKFSTATDEALALAKGTGLAIVSNSKVNLFQDIRVTYDLIKNQTIQGAAGYRISSSVLGLEAKLYSIVNHIDLRTKALIDLPERYAIDKLLKYYNKLLAPNKPSDSDMMIQAKNGIIPYTDYTNHLQEESGLSLADANAITAMRQQQIGKSDLRTYWTMARKGIITDAEWYLKAKVGHGYTDTDAKALYQEFYYTLSPMELFRISDLMPTTPTWIDKRLRALGFTDEDRALIAALIQARTTKDEVNQAWSIFADNFSWGLQTEDDLTAFLTANGVPDIQIKAKLVVANLLQQKVILKLMRDAEIYLYRKDVLSEELLLTHLQELNIGLAVANAITRNEAAKKGVDWEIPA
jgi:hypothetical protein